MGENGSGESGYTLIRDLPPVERPRERLRDYGAEQLATADLLAILLRTGAAGRSAVHLAQELLRRFGGVEGMHRASIRELCEVKGLGPAKAAEIKAALEIGARLKLQDGRERTLVKSPGDVARLLGERMSLLDQEVVRLLLLDSRNRLVEDVEVYKGSAHTAQVRIAELLRPALRAGAVSMILVHNHPSGDPAPSAPDIDLTKRLDQATRLMDIDLYDHVIIAGGRHVSMREYGLGFEDGR